MASSSAALFRLCSTDLKNFCDGLIVRKYSFSQGITDMAGEKVQMRTLIYKRTHCGDPISKTGVFGNHDCMGQVRGWNFDAVIGVGGTGSKPQVNGIAGKLTWVGIGPHKTGDSRCPQVTFAHFLYYGETGKPLSDIAPVLAKRLYDGKARVLMDSLSDEERREVNKILRLARNAQPSPGLKSASRPVSPQTGCKCRSKSRCVKS